MAEQIPFSIMENVLGSLGSFIVQKVGSMYGVRNELEKLEETLGTLKAILLDADQEQKQLEKSHAVKDWVKRLKRAVYAVDDLLDDSATHDQLQREGLARQVTHFFSSSNDIAFRYQMSGRLDDIKEALDEIKKDICLLSVIPRNTIHPLANNMERETHSSPSSTSNNLHLRDTEIGKIVNLLDVPPADNDQDIFIVAICGIGGLGKTTLAQLVFNDERVIKHFEPKIWVCVSDDSGKGFGANALLKKITKSNIDASLDDLKRTLHEMLSQKKYLLVLDDVWNKRTEDWEKVRPLLEVGAKGSKILVTTRNTEVSFMGDNTRPFELKGLGHDESWKLFSNITFGGQENSVSEEILKVGRQIVDMCNGVPLIINTLGGILMQFKSDLFKWVSIRHNENLLSLPHGNDNVLRVLKLSYDNLPTHLKQCFTYCVLFPQDYEIEKRLLVQLWIAQGYVQSPNGNEQLEDIGDRYFEELVSRSLLEKVTKYSTTSSNRLMYKMHGLIHDLAQSIVGSEVLVLRSDKSNVSREVRHVSLLEMVNPALKAIKGKSIRTFLNFCEDPSDVSTIVNSLLPSFMCLRALSLNDLNIKNVPQCLGKLSHLRYLDLSENGFEILPNSISRLKNLQTLNLRMCWGLKNFPKNMWDLTNLRHLENDGCSDWTHMPHGIGKLTSLQSLPLFVIGNDTAWWLRNHKVGSLSELKSLNQLRGLLCIQNLQNVRDVELVSRGGILEEKKHLQSLRLEWSHQADREGEGDKRVMEGLQPNPRLKELFIRGYRAKEFPSWMMNDELASRLPNLVKIEMSVCSECRTLPPFSQLPSLKSLKLHSMEELMKLKESRSSATAPVLFPSLELLELSYMTKLTDSLAEQGSSFPCLSELYINTCRDLASLHLPPSLSKSVIHDCNRLASLKLSPSSSFSKLEIRNCRSLASLELPSSSHLHELEIRNCSNLPSLELSSSSSLHILEIRNCSNLASLKLPSSSSLSKFVIYDCNELESLEMLSASSLSELEISNCNILASLELSSASSLSKLEIRNCSNLASLELSSSSLLGLLRINNCSNLESLKLPSSSSLSKLKINTCENLASLELSSASSLSELEISNCNTLASLELSSSSSLSKLEISNCNMLASLKLPSSSSLSKLVINIFNKLASLKLPSSSSLSKLEIRNCSNLASLELSSSSSLSKLEISNCSNLASLELPSFPSLSELEIQGCPLPVSFKVASPLPSLATLNLNCVGYDVIKQLKFVGAPSLKCLSIQRIDRIISLPKEMLQPFSGLEKLHINQYSQLKSLELPSFPSLSELEIKDCPLLASLELPSFPSLSELEIEDCPLLVSFKVAAQTLPSLAKLYLFSVRYEVIQQIMFVGSPSLKCLSIKCIDIITLPEEVLQHFSALVRLHIRECPALQSLKLPSFHGLSKLSIQDCPNLTSFNVASFTRLEELTLRRVRAEVLQKLIFVSASSSSLKHLYIREISVPEEPLQHVSTLQSLYIFNCSGLETLLHWMSSLSSLRALAIHDCRELTSLPKEIYSLNRLERLYLSGFQLTNEEQAQIARLPDVNLTMDSFPDDELLRIFYED